MCYVDSVANRPYYLKWWLHEENDGVLCLREGQGEGNIQVSPRSAKQVKSPRPSG